MYQRTRVSGDPALQSDSLCRLSIVSRFSNIHYAAVTFKRNSVKSRQRTVVGSWKKFLSGAYHGFNYVYCEAYTV